MMMRDGQELQWSYESQQSRQTVLVLIKTLRNLFSVLWLYFAFS
jgi:hypothetical protein